MNISPLGIRDVETKVLIIGGGFGGLAAAIALRKAGILDFRILEKSPGPGGVWWDNNYPGAEVDTPSHVYSFSFHTFDWSRSHADRNELLRYINDVIDKYGIRPHFNFGVCVNSVIWNEAQQSYLVETQQGRFRARAVISAVGLLNIPKYPNWPGLEKFTGPKFHTSRWEHYHDLIGKRVAVVGTGSTAIQVISALADKVGHLLIFQREPGWVVPKPIRVYTKEERKVLSRPLRYKIERIRAAGTREINRLGGRIFQAGTRPNLKARDISLKHVRISLPDRPDLQDAVTPTYPFMGKRAIRDSKFYTTLLRPNVKMVTRAVRSVEEHALIDTDGERHEIDVLVMSTGFQASNFLSQFVLRGRSGRTIQEAWDGSPRAFLGTMVPEFPNFFMIYGPNTNVSNLLIMFESQAKFAAKSIRRLFRLGAGSVEVSRTFYDRFNSWLDRRLAKTVWPTTNNYYKSSSGRIVTQWPDGNSVYLLLMRPLGRISLRYTGKCPRTDTPEQPQGSQPSYSSLPDGAQPWSEVPPR